MTFSTSNSNLEWIIIFFLQILADTLLNNLNAVFKGNGGSKTEEPSCTEDPNFNYFISSNWLPTATDCVGQQWRSNRQTMDQNDCHVRLLRPASRLSSSGDDLVISCVRGCTIAPPLQQLMSVRHHSERRLTQNERLRSKCKRSTVPFAAI